MTEKKYIDLLIKDDDLVLDSDGLPVMASDKASVNQDIRHAIRESGYLVEMVAERNSEKVDLLKQKIKIIVENDERVIPGTVIVSKNIIDNLNSETSYLVSADTYEFGNIKIK